MTLEIRHGIRNLILKEQLGIQAKVEDTEARFRRFICVHAKRNLRYTCALNTEWRITTALKGRKEIDQDDANMWHRSKMANTHP